MSCVHYKVFEICWSIFKIFPWMFEKNMDYPITGYSDFYISIQSTLFKSLLNFVCLTYQLLEGVCWNLPLL